MANTISQVSVDAQRDIGLPGQIADGELTTLEDNLPNAAGVTNSAQSFTVGVATLGDELTVREACTGESVSIFSTADAAFDAAALAAAINDNPVLAGLGAASDDGVSTVFYLVSSPDIDLVFSSDTTDITVNAPTPSSPGSAIGFGLPIYVDGSGNATTSRPAVGSIEDELYGISIRRLNRQAADVFSSDVKTDSRTDVSVLRSGRIYVAGGADAAKRGVVYVGVSADGEEGQLFTAAGGSRLPLPISAAEWYGPHCVELKLAH